MNPISTLLPAQATRPASAAPRDVTEWAAHAAARLRAAPGTKFSAVGGLSHCPECRGRGWTGDGTSPEDWCTAPNCRLGFVRDSDEGGICPRCAGGEWVGKDVAPGHPDFGVSFPCSCLSGNEKARLQWLSGAGVPRKFLTAEFERWPSRTPNREVALAMAQQAARGGVVDQYDRRGLLLYGPTGAGKSGLAASIVRGAWWRQHTGASLPVARWIGWPWFCDRLNDLRSSGESDQADVAAAFSADVLVIDDLGADEVDSGFRRRVLQQILDRRGQSTLIVTTMYDLEVLANGIGDHNIGRLLEACVPLEISGPDIRRQPGAGKGGVG